MGREKEPFHRRWHSQDRRRREQEDEYGLYQDELEYDEDDEYEVGDIQDVYEKGPNVPRRRSRSPLPPHPSTTRNIYPHTSRSRRMPKSRTPTPPIRPTQATRSQWQTDLPAEPQPSSRRSTGAYQRPLQQTRHTDDFPRRPAVPPNPRKRKVWPIFLIGCTAGAVSLVLAVAIVALIVTKIPGATNDDKAIVGKSDTQSVQLSALSQLLVCDPAGNISLSIDPDATSTTITTTKKALHATDQNDANQKVRQISVSIEAQPPSQPQKSLTCQKPQASNISALNTTPTATNNSVLTVNVTFPPNQAGQTATVDVAIILPKPLVQVADPTNTTITIEALLGSIDVNGISGIMNLKGGLDSNIIVRGGAIVDGSHLTTSGTITLNDILYEKKDPQNPQHNIKNQHYILNDARQIDVTLPENTNVILDANTNVGKISSEFPIQIHNTSENGPACYYGYLNGTNSNNNNSSTDYCPKIDNPETPVLTVNVSTGNISIHKAKIPQNIP